MLDPGKEPWANHRSTAPSPKESSAKYGQSTLSTLAREPDTNYYYSSVTSACTTISSLSPKPRQQTEPFEKKTEEKGHPTNKIQTGTTPFYDIHLAPLFLLALFFFLCISLSFFLLINISFSFLSLFPPQLATLPCTLGLPLPLHADSTLPRVFCSTNCLATVAYFAPPQRRFHLQCFEPRACRCRCSSPGSHCSNPLRGSLCRHSPVILYILQTRPYFCPYTRLPSLSRSIQPYSTFVDACVIWRNLRVNRPLPGWSVPQIHPSIFADFGLIVSLNTPRLLKRISWTSV